MDLFEYQARDLFEKYGVPVLAGIVADTPEEARAAAEKLGGVTVVKAQVKTGGRGKAGGVKVAKTPDEAEEAAKAILGLDIKGHVVKRVMVAAGADIAEEYYFSVLLDRANRSYLSLAQLRGRHGHRGRSRSRRPRRSPASRSTRSPASTSPKADEIAGRREVPRRAASTRSPPSS